MSKSSVIAERRDHNARCDRVAFDHHVVRDAEAENVLFHMIDPIFSFFQDIFGKSV